MDVHRHHASKNIFYRLLDMDHAPGTFYSPPLHAHALLPHIRKFHLNNCMQALFHTKRLVQQVQHVHKTVVSPPIRLKQERGGQTHSLM